jgi:hypothetical protein
MSVPAFPWYALAPASSTLEQGDFLQKITAPVTATEQPTDAAALVDEYDRVVVLTQSCDLIQGDVSRVMLCPIYELEKFLAPVSKGKQDSWKDALQKGRKLGYQLLNVCTLEGFSSPHLVADFPSAFSIPYADAKAEGAKAPRLRLLPPYREYLSQAFARFYMRIGLPVDVDPLP